MNTSTHVDSNTTPRKRLRLFLVALVAMLAVPTTVALSPANSVSASCTAAKETRAETGLDSNRARVRCTSIASDTKVRAKLNRNNGPDYTGSWFTTTYKNYYSPWGACAFGCSATYDRTAR